VWAFGVVKDQVFADGSPRLGNAVVSVQIYLFIFDGSPQPFDEDVISPGSLSIHADRDVSVFENFDEVN